MLKKKFRIILLLSLNLLILNCTTPNQTKTNIKIKEYESSGSILSAISLGVPGAAILFLTVDINNYLKFNLNNKEIDLHENAIHVALNNSANGEIVSWHNGDRLSSGKVRVVKTYYKNEKYCRIFQSYIKLNLAENHTTKHICRINNVWRF